jgi:hypothetical protein
MRPRLSGLEITGSSFMDGGRCCGSKKWGKLCGMSGGSGVCKLRGGNLPAYLKIQLGHHCGWK